MTLDRGAFCGCFIHSRLWSLTVWGLVNGFDMGHSVCWGTLPFSRATTKGSLWPRVPQALYNEGPSLVQSPLFTAILSLATVSKVCPRPFIIFVVGRCGKFNSSRKSLFLISLIIYSFVLLVFTLVKWFNWNVSHQVHLWVQFSFKCSLVF